MWQPVRSCPAGRFLAVKACGKGMPCCGLDAGQRPTCCCPESEGGCRGGHDGPAEPAGHRVGQALHGCLPALGICNQAANAGQGGVCPSGGGLHSDGALIVDCACRHLQQGRRHMGVSSDRRLPVLWGGAGRARHAGRASLSRPGKVCRSRCQLVACTDKWRPQAT